MNVETSAICIFYVAFSTSFYLLEFINLIVIYCYYFSGNKTLSISDVHVRKLSIKYLLAKKMKNVRGIRFKHVSVELEMLRKRRQPIKYLRLLIGEHLWRYGKCQTLPRFVYVLSASVLTLRND